MWKYDHIFPFKTMGASKLFTIKDVPETLHNTTLVHLIIFYGHGRNKYYPIYTKRKIIGAIVGIELFSIKSYVQ